MFNIKLPTLSNTWDLDNATPHPTPATTVNVNFKVVPDPDNPPEAGAPPPELPQDVVTAGMDEAQLLFDKSLGQIRQAYIAMSRQADISELFEYKQAMQLNEFMIMRYMRIDPNYDPVGNEDSLKGLTSEQVEGLFLGLYAARETAYRESLSLKRRAWGELPSEREIFDAEQADQDTNIVFTGEVWDQLKRESTKLPIGHAIFIEITVQVPTPGSKMDELLRALPDLWLQIDVSASAASKLTSVPQGTTVDGSSRIDLAEVLIRAGGKNGNVFGYPYWAFDSITEGLIVSHPHNVYYGKKLEYVYSTEVNESEIYSNLPQDLARYYYPYITQNLHDYTASPAMNDYSYGLALEGVRAAEFSALGVPVPFFVGDQLFYRLTYHVGKLLKLEPILNSLTYSRLQNFIESPLFVSISATDAALGYTQDDGASGVSFSAVSANWEITWGVGNKQSAINLGPQSLYPRPPYGVKFKRVRAKLSGSRGLPRDKVYPYQVETRTTGTPVEICRAELSILGGGKKLLG